MIRFFTDLWHALTSPTVGEYLSKSQRGAERAYNVRVDRATVSHAKALGEIQATAHRQIVVAMNMDRAEFQEWDGMFDTYARGVGLRA